MKVLVVHVPAGSGHQRAAEAITAAFHPLQASAEVSLLDALEGSDSSYQWAFTRGYLGFIDSAPWLWGLLYHLTDLSVFSGPVHALHRFNNGWHGKDLERIFLDHRADVIIGTHFFPMEVAGFLKSKGRLWARLITVITDYLPHALWIAPAIDTYVVGSDEAKKSLLARGIPPDRIQVLGIPVDPRFSQPLNRDALQKRLGLDPGRFTLLVGAGGAGTGPVISIVNALDRLNEPIQFLVVAGKNATLFEQLETLRPRMHHPMKVYGFINNMEELMSVSDLFVTKPGGLSCAEAMAVGLPLLLLVPVPGQESRNAHFLEKTGTALVVKRPEELTSLIEKLRMDRSRLQAMSRKGMEMGRPDAAIKIARMVVG